MTSERPAGEGVTDPADAMEEALINLGVKPGGCLIVHSDVTGWLSAGLSPGDILTALERVVTPEGTLVLPTFNFDWCDGKGFDLRRTPSQMGMITEIARRRPGYVRTAHPVYSLVVSGPLAGEFMRYDNPSAYGVGSGFEVLRRLGAQALVVGLPWTNSMTFLHHVEERLQVPYRYYKSFSGNYKDSSGSSTEREYFLYVRDLEAGVETDFDEAEQHFVETGVAAQGTVLGVRCTLTDISALFDETCQTLDDRPGFLHRIERTGD